CCTGKASRARLHRPSTARLRAVTRLDRSVGTTRQPVTVAGRNSLTAHTRPVRGLDLGRSDRVRQRRVPTLETHPAELALRFFWPRSRRKAATRARPLAAYRIQAEFHHGPGFPNHVRRVFATRSDSTAFETLSLRLLVI